MLTSLLMKSWAVDCSSTVIQTNLYAASFSHSPCISLAVYFTSQGSHRADLEDTIRLHAPITISSWPFHAQ